MTQPLPQQNINRKWHSPRMTSHILCFSLTFPSFPMHNWGRFSGQLHDGNPLFKLSFLSSLSCPNFRFSPLLSAREKWIMGTTKRRREACGMKNHEGERWRRRLPLSSCEKVVKGHHFHNLSWSEPPVCRDCPSTISVFTGMCKVGHIIKPAQISAYIKIWGFCANCLISCSTLPGQMRTNALPVFLHSKCWKNSRHPNQLCLSIGLSKPNISSKFEQIIQMAYREKSKKPLKLEFLAIYTNQFYNLKAYLAS